MLAEGTSTGTSDADVVAVARKLLIHTLAHEIGHVLELAHFAGGEQQTGAAGTSNIRHDLEAHTNLMHNFANLDQNAPKPANNAAHLYNSPMRAEIGYAKSLFYTGGSPTTSVLVSRPPT